MSLTSSSSYLPLSGGTITGQFNIQSSGIANQFLIKNTSASSYASMQFTNNFPYDAFIGVGGSSIAGNYANNFFLEANDGMVFNTGGNVSASTPKMIILANGNVGIGTTSPISLFHIEGTNSVLSICSQSGAGEISQIDLNQLGW